MSFSQDTKRELSRLKIEKKCDQLAEISGFLRVAGSIRLAGMGRFKIVCGTDNPAVARHYKILLNDYFGIDTSLEIGEPEGPRKLRRYYITISPEMRSEQILRETGILLVREGNNYISDGIYDDIIRSKCCKRAYLRGLFMGVGTISDPEKSYHLEWVLTSENLAMDLKKMIGSFVNLKGKYTTRKGSHIIYIKNSEHICDTLSLMGADQQRLIFEEVKIKKGIRIEAVRMTNCDNANMDRTLDASQRMLEKIRKIDRIKGLDWLSPKLKEVAILRMENPEASLVQLGEMLEPPLKKSGINNRFKKIGEIADRLEE